MNRVAADLGAAAGVRAARDSRRGRPARRLALLIAVGIGLHNFAEGLAIGQAAATSEIALGHAAGNRLRAPQRHRGLRHRGAAGRRDESRRLARDPELAAASHVRLIGGGPTFVGTAIGRSFTSEALSVVFLSLAAGSILYVVVQLIGVAAKTRRMDLLAYGMLIGLLAGFLTDAIVTAAGV